jgi:hypothetical protein
MVFWRSALLATMAVSIAGAASAQQAPMSEDVVWKLLEIGRVIDPAKTAALFAPMQAQEPYQGVKVEREIKYGHPIGTCSTSSRLTPRLCPGRC